MASRKTHARFARLRAALGVFALGLALCAPWTHAGTIEDAADRAAAAHEAGDVDTLRAIATGQKPDPWDVADELCARGHFDAAEAIARLAEKPAHANLPAYVARMRTLPPPTEIRKALDGLERAYWAKQYEKAIALAEATDTSRDDMPSLRIWVLRAASLRHLRRGTVSARAYEKAAQAALRAGHTVAAASHYKRAAFDARKVSNWQEAVRLGKVRLALAEQAADLKQIANSCYYLGQDHKNLGLYGPALEFYAKALAVDEKRGKRMSMASALEGMGVVHARMGRLEEAERLLTQALGIRHETDAPKFLARTMGNLANVQKSRGRYREALETLQASLAIRRSIGDQRGIASALHNLGNVQRRLGELERAVACSEEALSILRELGDRDAIASALATLGNTNRDRGRYSEALDLLGEALGLRRDMDDRVGIADVLHSLGDLHIMLGDVGRARVLLEEALKIRLALGHSEQVAGLLSALAGVLMEDGHLEEARRLEERALAIHEKGQDPIAHATALQNLATIVETMEEAELALTLNQRALEIAEETGDRGLVAAVLQTMAISYRYLERFDEAIHHARRALTIGEEIGATARVIRSHWTLALTYHEAGRHRECIAAARRAIELLPVVIGRLSDRQATRVREVWQELFQTGVRSARILSDPNEAAFFMESGRAGALLEALGGREALREAVLPEGLRAAETDARLAAEHAEARLRRAARLRRPKEILAAREARTAAFVNLQQAVERIQRESKAAADVAYPCALPLEEIRTLLGKGEALVLYHLDWDVTTAVVATRKGARLVPLGRTSKIKRALKNPATLRRLVVTPLGLESIDRVLVSPAGELGHAPFGQLFDVEVACLPSATTYAHLVRETHARGEKVLAIGDPPYRRLPPLPSARAEAKAIGDRVLLGEKATAKTLRKTLAEQPRWSAVHLACHGVIDTKEPLASFLALADGPLTTLDLLTLDVPADLVVLSACDTARGTVYQAEGIVGFTRALMLAGTPRVICSLWKVDDEATRALMIEFYELWRPKEGGPGRGAAAALRGAQEFVRGQAEWSDPHFWAAWVLWGLPD